VFYIGGVLVDLTPAPFGSWIAELLPRNFAPTEQSMAKVIAFNRQLAYQWYLNSKFWRERRVAAFRRAKGICEHCKTRPATEVHHRTYLRVFDEHPNDLVALCRPCHADIHFKTPANDNQFGFNFDPDTDGKS
jgi:hypothetical protein